VAKDISGRSIPLLQIDPQKASSNKLIKQRADDLCRSSTASQACVQEIAILYKNTDAILRRMLKEVGSVGIALR